VPEDYWEYKLVDEHFRGDWMTYWMMPEPELWKIKNFIKYENEAREILNRRRNRGNK
jgi:hypothetical protein